MSESPPTEQQIDEDSQDERDDEVVHRGDEFEFEPKTGFWRRARARRHRFVDRYEQRREQSRLGQASPYMRPLRVTFGVVLIVIGILIGWLPGPGFIIFAFPGALLIASEWRRAAVLLDQVENETVPWLQRTYAWLRGGPKEEWVREDPQLWGLPLDRRSSDGSDTGERRRRSDSRRERRAAPAEEDEE